MRTGLTAGADIRYDVESGGLECFGKAAKLGTEDGRLSLRVPADRVTLEMFARYDAFVKNWNQSGSPRAQGGHCPMKIRRLSTYISAVLLLFALDPASAPAAGDRPPNIVFIFIDDMGYGDIGPFGSTLNKTPNLDRMAAEGVKLTQFYVSSTACTPSRSALMTGSYADRVGMDGRVVFPAEARGLHPDEITIAELLKAKGYATGCFGKWHLGDQPGFLPLRQGFDEYVGTPYSNDMWPFNKNKKYVPLPLVVNDQPVARISDGDDQALMCKVFTDAAVNFMKRHRDEPFFVYLPHAFIQGSRARRFLRKPAGTSSAPRSKRWTGALGKCSMRWRNWACRTTHW